MEHLIGHPHPPGFVLQELRQLGNLGRGEIPLLHLTSIASLQLAPPNGTSSSLVITEGQMVTTTTRRAPHATSGIPEDRLPDCVPCAQIAGGGTDISAGLILAGGEPGGVSLVCGLRAYLYGDGYLRPRPASSTS